MHAGVQGNVTDSTMSGYPLRTKCNANNWAVLTPNTGAITKGHPTGGRQHTLVLVPHFGGRVRKRPVADDPYSPSNPCHSKKSGQGSAFLGYYQRDEHLARKHKPRFRGPRYLPAPPDESSTQFVYSCVSLLILWSPLRVECRSVTLP